MHKLTTLSFFLFFISTEAITQDLDYYFGNETVFDTSIPTPESILGYQVGEWHVNHDKVVEYMKVLAEKSERIEIEEYARSHENKPLLVLKISSSKNIQNLETIRTNHLLYSSGQTTKSVKDQPVIINLGYSVHGNEASGTNAAILVAYYLAAAQGKEISNWLNHSVILLDPSLNPDGLDRFSHWVNTRKSLHLVSDPNNYEQNEAWPNGRTNHYWFDLNRDWMPLQHPESQGRVRLFHQWKPHVLTDHHEMGSNSTYFFQPGVPSRNNPLTPIKNYQLTAQIAAYHAKALDKIGTLYYSEEDFDDFYIGKGSTYPDVNGSIGILFEQASARSHLQMTKNGLLSFPFAIRNHLTTSLSTIKAANELKNELLNHQKEFFETAIKLSKQDPIKAYVFGGIKDLSRIRAFVSILDQHQIKVHQLEKGFNQYKSKESFLVSLNQPQYRLIKSLFDQPTQFNDSLFYDVSAWTLPLAFNIPFEGINQKELSLITSLEISSASDLKQAPQKFNKSDYAYAFQWHDYFSPALLYSLQQNGLLTKVITQKLTTKKNETLTRGTIIIPVLNQKLDSDELYHKLINLSEPFGIPFISFDTGLTNGINLGSPKIKVISQPKPLLVVGKGVSAYEAGEVWHLMDQRMKVPLPMVTMDQVNVIDLKKYNTLILVNGSYGKLSQEKIKTWVLSGGTIIAIKSATKWVESAGLSKAKIIKHQSDTSHVKLAYEDLNNHRGANVIGGAIFSNQVDLSHPICFGFENDHLATFRNSRLMTLGNKNPYSNPVRYSAEPLMAGYISDQNLEQIKNSAAVSITTFGKGNVISFIDNPNFRGFWYGTNKLFLNAVFFNRIISSHSAR